jgi:hypothetical protein
MVGLRFWLTYAVWPTEKQGRPTAHFSFARILPKIAPDQFKPEILYVGRPYASKHLRGFETYF